MNYRILKLQTYVWLQGCKVVWEVFLEVCLLSIFTGGYSVIDQKDKKSTGTIVSNFFFKFSLSFVFFLFTKLFISCKRPSKLYSLQVPKIDRRLGSGCREVCAGECFILVALYSYSHH